MRVFVLEKKIGRIKWKLRLETSNYDFRFFSNRENVSGLFFTNPIFMMHISPDDLAKFTPRDKKNQELLKLISN